MEKRDVNQQPMEDEGKEASYNFAFSRTEVSLIGSALALAVEGAWLFSPDQTIDDDIRASAQMVAFLQRFNSALPLELRQGCVSQEFLRYSFGDVYVGAAYRLETRVKGSVIAVAEFSPGPDHIAFRLFDPVKYPNARRLSECLGESVPLGDITALEEVSSLTEAEKEAFGKAIACAWANHY